MAEGVPMFGAVDLGADKFCVLAARQAGGSYEVTGVGFADAAGFSAGQITHLGEATEALAHALRQAELDAGGPLDIGVVAGVSGDHLHGEDRLAHVKIQGGAVSEDDKLLVLDTLQAFRVDNGMEILHVLEQGFSIDGNAQVTNPNGMAGGLLEAYAHVLTASTYALSNLRRCVTDAKLTLGRSMCTALAAGSAITTADERDLGVLALDWGASTCDIAIFCGGVPRLLRTRALGGRAIDRDIARMHNISQRQARRVKERIGSATQVAVDNEASIEIRDVNGVTQPPIEPNLLSMTIEPQVDEMIRQLMVELEGWCDRSVLPAGIVLAGGMANLRGLDEVMRDKLQLPIRIGKSNYSGPHKEHVDGPAHAAALGLLDLWVSQGLAAHQSTTPPSGLGSWFRNLLGREET